MKSYKDVCKVEDWTKDWCDFDGDSVYLLMAIAVPGRTRASLIFRSAIEYGKYWHPETPHWRKPEERQTNEEIFRRSVWNWVNEVTGV